jgi:hypothetical protein
MAASALSEIKADMVHVPTHPVRVRVLEALTVGNRSVGDLQAHLRDTQLLLGDRAPTVSTLPGAEERGMA